MCNFYNCKNYRAKPQLLSKETFQTLRKCFSSFFIDSEATNYVLRVDGYSGTAGDSLQHPRALHDNQPFTTLDRDNDNYSG